MYLKVTNIRHEETVAEYLSADEVLSEMKVWQAREKDGLEVIEDFPSGSIHIRWPENVGLYHTAYIPVECVEGLMP